MNSFRKKCELISSEFENIRELKLSLRSLRSVILVSIIYYIFNKNSLVKSKVTTLTKWIFKIKLIVTVTDF